MLDTVEVIDISLSPACHVCFQRVAVPHESVTQPNCRSCARHALPERQRTASEVSLTCPKTALHAGILHLSFSRSSAGWSQAGLWDSERKIVRNLASRFTVSKTPCFWNRDGGASENISAPHSPRKGMSGQVKVKLRSNREQ